MRQIQFGLTPKKNKSDSNLISICEPELCINDIKRVIGGFNKAIEIKNAAGWNNFERLLDNFFNKVPVQIPFEGEKGLCRFGLGLIFLFHNGWVEGDEENILACIDRLQFHVIAQNNNEAFIEWAGCFRYFRYRISWQNSSGNLLNELVNKHHLIYLLDSIFMVGDRKTPNGLNGWKCWACLYFVRRGLCFIYTILVRKIPGLLIRI